MCRHVKTCVVQCLAFRDWVERMETTSMVVGVDSEFPPASAFFGRPHLLLLLLPQQGLIP